MSLQRRQGVQRALQHDELRGARRARQVAERAHRLARRRARAAHPATRHYANMNIANINKILDTIMYSIEVVFVAALGNIHT